ncbi:hypothetical protein HBA54_09135 [Pelagibius litoralis]|uniref:Outer membrane lipoprotein-sorting protein n=1 Tax=Pelagibius litoralis TaxID=374515 RepID=A0A967C302_9PROT|nr:hypothetical protein [Pelagibius litoralis]NIA68753.1 hypothetical protein [Pelagibius litoralis]
MIFLSHSARSARYPLTLIALVFSFSAGLPALASDVLPAPTASYSADTLVRYAGETLEMKTLNRGPWERQEFILDEQTQVTILRPDRNRAYVMFVESRQLFELPYAEAALLPSIGVLRSRETTKLSDTTLAGEAVGHFQVFQEFEGDGAEEEPAVLDLWVTPDGIVMKAEGEILVDGYREPLQLLRKNLQRRDLDPDVFEPSIALDP